MDSTDWILVRSVEIIDSNPTAVFLLIGINDLYNNTIESPSINYIANNIINIAKKNFKLLKTKSLDNLVPEYIGNFEVK